MMILIVQEDTLETGLDEAYSSFNHSAAVFLAENAGLNPIHIVTQLRKRHRAGERDAGINVKQGCIDNMYTLNVVQPLLVNISALHLATECIALILKIDDLVLVR
jgi:T-complex protein 1 subunit delta